MSRRALLNPGDPDRALPFGASCSASCQHVDECRTSHGIKGNEGECVHTPSKFLPNVHRDRDMDPEDALSSSDFS